MKLEEKKEQLKIKIARRQEMTELVSIFYSIPNT